LDDDGFTGLNQVSTVGAFLLGASTLPFLWNALQTWRGRLGRVAGDDPWEGHTLEWATTSPPAPENFTAPLPPIRSQRPVWDLHHGAPAAPAAPGVPGGDGRSEGDRATGDGGPSGESASGGAPEEAP
jgi:cytochrome c oxidase subunit 1